MAQALPIRDRIAEPPPAQPVLQRPADRKMANRKHPLPLRALVWVSASAVPWLALYLVIHHAVPI